MKKLCREGMKSFRDVKEIVYICCRYVFFHRTALLLFVAILPPRREARRIFRMRNPRRGRGGGG